MPEARPYDPSKDLIDTQGYERVELEGLLGGGNIHCITQQVPAA